MSFNTSLSKKDKLIESLLEENRGAIYLLGGKPTSEVTQEDNEEVERLLKEILRLTEEEHRAYLVRRRKYWDSVAENEK